MSLSDIDIFVLQMSRCAGKYGFKVVNFSRPSKEGAYRCVDMRKLRHEGHGIELYPSISIAFDYDPSKWKFFVKITLCKSINHQIVRVFNLADILAALKFVDAFASDDI